MPQERYLSTDPNAGQAPSAYLSTDPHAGEVQQPAFRTTNEKDASGNAVVDFLSELKSINPVAIKQAIDQTFWHPIDTAKGMLTAQDEVRLKAQDALKRGDYTEALAHGIYWLLPIIGPQLDRAGGLMREGKYAQGAGATVDAGLQVAAPELIRRVPSVNVRALPRNPNPAEQAAVQFGQREGIPVDAATATGNPFVRAAQWSADRTAAGSVVAGKARQTQADAFATVGDRLASQAHGAPVTAEQAGQAITNAVTTKGATEATTATNAYTKLRTFEEQQGARIAQTGGVQAPSTSAQPFTNVPLAVDIAPTKAAMKPTYDALLRKKELVGSLMGDEARALTSLDALMQAPGMAPLSVADAALSDLKSLSRVDQAFRRTAGQGVAAQAVQSLDKSVVAAAKQFDALQKTPKGGAFDALMDGRAATVNKYKAIDVLDSLRKGGAEPVEVFRQLTANQDSAVNLLRKVQREAPKELPKLGRAFLEGLLEKSQHGTKGGAAIFSDWQRMGPQTKQLLFQDPALVKDLDSFFLLAKKAAENPNPSGTAFTVAASAQGMFIVSNPIAGTGIQLAGAGLAKALHSPRVVNALMVGLKMPAGKGAGVVTATAELMKAARSAGIELNAVPVGAEASDQPATPSAAPQGAR